MAPPLIAPVPVRAAWRSWLFLLIVGPYPLLLGVLSGAFHFREPAGPESPGLPGGWPELLAVCGVNLAIFGAIFLVGYLLGKPRKEELYLRSVKWMDVLWGAFWSLGLRFILMALMLVALGVIYVAQGGGELDPKVIRPKIENLIDPHALEDPIYLLLSITVVSMVTAGLREELWRAGCMAPLQDLLPASWKPSGIPGADNWKNHRARWCACLVAAVIFGFGHLPQGEAGVAVTTVLGLGLGLVMIYHRSLWVAALAHGFFDATTFVFLGILQKFLPKIVEQMLGK
jgi:membrane protease YdiL (CAAX protease family)